MSTADRRYEEEDDIGGGEYGYGNGSDDDEEDLDQATASPLERLLGDLAGGAGRRRGGRRMPPPPPRPLEAGEVDEIAAAILDPGRREGGEGGSSREPCAPELSVVQCKIRRPCDPAAADSAVRVFSRLPGLEEVRVLFSAGDGDDDEKEDAPPADGESPPFSPVGSPPDALTLLLGPAAAAACQRSAEGAAETGGPSGAPAPDRLVPARGAPPPPPALRRRGGALDLALEVAARSASLKTLDVAGRKRPEEEEDDDDSDDDEQRGQSKERPYVAAPFLLDRVVSCRSPLETVRLRGLSLAAPPAARGGSEPASGGGRSGIADPAISAAEGGTQENDLWGVNRAVKTLCVTDCRLGTEAMHCLARFRGLETIHLHNVRVVPPPGSSASAPDAAGLEMCSPGSSFRAPPSLRCLTVRADGDDPELLRWLAAPSPSGSEAVPLFPRLEVAASVGGGSESLRMLSAVQELLHNCPASELVLRLDARDHRDKESHGDENGDDNGGEGSCRLDAPQPALPNRQRLCAGIAGASPRLSSLVLHLRGGGAGASAGDLRGVLDAVKLNSRLGRLVLRCHGAPSGGPRDGDSEEEEDPDQAEDLDEAEGPYRAEDREPAEDPGRRELGDAIEGFVAKTRLEHLGLGLYPWAASTVAEYALRGLRRNAAGRLRSLQCFSHETSSTQATSQVASSELTLSQDYPNARGLVDQNPRFQQGRIGALLAPRKCPALYVINGDASTASLAPRRDWGDVLMRVSNADCNSVVTGLARQALYGTPRSNTERDPLAAASGCVSMHPQAQWSQVDDAVCGDRGGSSVGVVEAVTSARATSARGAFDGIGASAAASPPLLSFDEPSRTPSNVSLLNLDADEIDRSVKYNDRVIWKPGAYVDSIERVPFAEELAYDPDDLIDTAKSTIKADQLADLIRDVGGNEPWARHAAYVASAPLPELANGSGMSKLFFHQLVFPPITALVYCFGPENCRAGQDVFSGLFCRTWTRQEAEVDDDSALSSGGPPEPAQGTMVTARNVEFSCRPGIATCAHQDALVLGIVDLASTGEERGVLWSKRGEEADGMFNCVVLTSATAAAMINCNAADRVAIPFVMNTGEYAKLYVTTMEKGEGEAPAVKRLMIAKMSNQEERLRIFAHLAVLIHSLLVSCKSERGRWTLMNELVFKNPRNRWRKRSRSDSESST